MVLVRKQPGKTPELSPVPLRPQPHGGALRSGNPDPPTTGGRPPSELRRVLRQSAGDRIKILEEIADGPGMKPRDRLQAIDVLLRYGLGPREGWDREAVVDLMQELGTVVAELVDDQQVLLAIKERWLAILRSRSK